MFPTSLLQKALEFRKTIQRLRWENMDEFRRLFDVFFFELQQIVHNGECRTYCSKRLKIMETKFELYKVEHGEEEEGEQRNIGVQDFYQVTKVDTHVHLSTCMNQKHLLRFIQHKAKVEPHTLVWKNKTLEQVFHMLNIDPDRLTTDRLNMRANDTFERFDLFMLKYSPAQKSLLREIFMKYDNDIEGRFLAEILKEVLFDLEKGKYVFVEYRVSIYGKHKKEWSILANWIKTHDLLHPNLQLLVQIPRLYQLHKQDNYIQNFKEMMNNIFDPVMDASLHPEKHSLVAWALSHITGFDCVDDESLPEPTYSSDMLPASQYRSFQNPPYVYFLLHIFYRIQVINDIRRERKLTTFAFRPHCGEAASLEHLTGAFLLADGINHGILLDQNPVLQYLYYLARIPISVSPLSNNQLFVHLNKNPFIRFFKRGLFVTLSTDNPCLTHLSNEPLMEEYSVVGQLFRLGSVDMCEIARNSIQMSSFQEEWKQFHSSEPNSNVPSMRLRFREQIKKEEFETLKLKSRL